MTGGSVGRAVAAVVTGLFLLSMAFFACGPIYCVELPWTAWVRSTGWGGSLVAVLEGVREGVVVVGLVAAVWVWLRGWIR